MIWANYTCSYPYEILLLGHWIFLFCVSNLNPYHFNLLPLKVTLIATCPIGDNSWLNMYEYKSDPNKIYLAFVFKLLCIIFTILLLFLCHVYWKWKSISRINLNAMTSRVLKLKDMQIIFTFMTEKILNSLSDQ